MGIILPWFVCAFCTFGHLSLTLRLLKHTTINHTSVQQSTVDNCLNMYKCGYIPNPNIKINPDCASPSCLCKLQHIAAADRTGE